MWTRPVCAAVGAGACCVADLFSVVGVRNSPGATNQTAAWGQDPVRYRNGIPTGMLHYVATSFPKIDQAFWLDFLNVSWNSNPHLCIVAANPTLSSSVVKITVFAIHSFFIIRYFWKWVGRFAPPLPKKLLC